jgi:hypothetical protein
MKRKWREVIVAYFSALSEHLKERQNNTTITSVSTVSFSAVIQRGMKHHIW